MSAKAHLRAGSAATAALAAGVALGAWAAAPAAADSAGGAGEQGVRGCLSGDFKPVYEGRDAAAGTDYIRVTLVRIQGGEGSDETCTVTPPASMHWVDELGGEQVGDWAEANPDQPGAFDVEPGGTAEVVVAQPHPGNYPEEECKAQDVAGFQLYLDQGSSDDGVYASTGGEDTMCTVSGAAVPTLSVKPAA